MASQLATAVWWSIVCQSLVTTICRLVPIAHANVPKWLFIGHSRGCADVPAAAVPSHAVPSKAAAVGKSKWAKRSAPSTASMMMRRAKIEVVAMKIGEIRSTKGSWRWMVGEEPEQPQGQNELRDPHPLERGDGARAGGERAVHDGVERDADEDGDGVGARVPLEEDGGGRGAVEDRKRAQQQQDRRETREAEGDVGEDREEQSVALGPHHAEHDELHGGGERVDARIVLGVHLLQHLQLRVGIAEASLDDLLRFERRPLEQ